MGLSGWQTAWFVVTLWAATGIASQAQTFTNLVTFDITNGAYPYGTLVQGLDGNMYGITAEGGRQRCSGGCGTIFNVTPEGTLTTVHGFVGTDGANPVTGLVMAATGNFYGSTFGKAPQGSVNGTEPSYFFELTPDGTLTNLLVGGSTQPLVQDTIDGNFYGTNPPVGVGAQEGTIFKMTAAGTLTTLHNFCQIKNCPDGSEPMAPLFQGNDVFLYGTTATGGDDGVLCDNSTGCGTVFKIGLGGSLIGCTLSTLLTARTLKQGSYKAQTGTSTGQPVLVGSLPVLALCSKFHPGERSRACTSFVLWVFPVLMERTRPQLWCKLPTATFTGRPSTAEMVSR